MGRRDGERETIRERRNGQRIERRREEGRDGKEEVQEGDKRIGDTKRGTKRMGRREVEMQRAKERRNGQSIEEREGRGRKQRR